MLSKLSILISVILFLGCRSNNLEYSKKEAFDELTQSVSRYSASIDSREINWDSLVEHYDSRVNEDLSEKEFFELIMDMLLEFRDPHVHLISSFDTMYSIDYLGYSRNNDELVTSQYISNIVTHSTNIKSGYINDSLGYLFCSDFKGDLNINNDIYESIISQFSETKGLILDFRVNDGGSVYNAQNLLNKFTAQRTLWHTTQNRNLNGFDDKYEWYLDPDPVIFYPNKIVVLNGRYTISAGERFAIGAKILDNIEIVGDTTSNTQGSVLGREMINGWKYNLTFEKCLDPNGINYGGKGIPPDHLINSNNAFINNRDNVLEKAIKLFN